MSVSNKIAHFQGRRDEVPNQQLAQELANGKNQVGIREIASNLWNTDKHVQADCLKVLYEIGYLDPRLVAPYTDDFLNLLVSRNNRLAWGSMIALSTVAAIEAKKLYAKRDVLQKAIEAGSIITVDNGIKTLARVAAQSETYRHALFPYLLEHLRTCRPKDVPQHAESVRVAVTSENKQTFIEVLEQRMIGMPAARAARLKRVIKAIYGSVQGTRE
jgi:hypothetical protein